MDEFARSAVRESHAQRIVRRQWFWLHVAVFLTSQVLLFVIWVVGLRGHPWFVYPLLGWLVLVAAHVVHAFVMRTPHEIVLDHEMRDADSGA